MTIHPSAYKAVITFGVRHKGETLGAVYESDPQYVRFLSGSDGIPPIWREAAALTVAGLSVEHLSLPTALQTYTLPAQASTSAGKIRLWGLKNGKIGVSFSHNKNNSKDVSRLEDFKTMVESRKWIGAPDFHWEVSPASIRQLGSFCTKWFGKPNTDADEFVRTLYREEARRRTELDAIREKTDIEFYIPGLHVEPYGYQKVGVKFVDRAGGRAMLFDAPGVGKTLQAIAYGVYKNLKTLVIVPKNAKIQWVRQIRRIANVDACLWEGSSFKGDLHSQFHVINYDIVEKNLSQLLTLQFDFLVLDEITKILNRNAKRTKAIIGNWKERSVYPGIKTPHVLLLSGTPITKHHLQLFSLLRFVAPTRFGNWKRYTDSYGGPRETPRNLAQLNHELKDIMLRRTKAEVMPDLPEKQYNPIYVELTPSQMEQYTRMMQRVLGTWRSGMPSAAEMHEVQQFLMDIKFDAIVELNDEYLEQGEAVLNFCQYRDPIRRLAEHYGKAAALIDGEKSAKARQKEVDRMCDGEAKIGCFTLFAAGEAIDGLQHVTTTVNHLNMYYVPWIHEQAEDRSHRQGQTGQVQVNYFIAANTIDEDMWYLLDQRHKMIQEMLDGKAPSEDIDKLKRKSFFKEFIQRTRARLGANDIDISRVSDEEGTKIVEE